MDSSLSIFQQNPCKILVILFLQGFMPISNFYKFLRSLITLELGEKKVEIPSDVSIPILSK